jgi:hypothetical protein
MCSSRSFTFPTQGTWLAIVTTVFTLDLLAVVARVMAALVAVASLFTRARPTLVGFCTQIAALDSYGDSLAQLLLLCMGGHVLTRLFFLAQRSLTTRIVRPGGAP